MARTTRDDVARLAGTSTAVVSYVINGGPRPVAAATRERVLAAIAELGYRPNTIARGLAARRTNLLGVVVPDSTNPFFAQLARAVEQAAFDRGSLTLTGSTSYDHTIEQRYLDAFFDLNVAAVVLVNVDGPARTRRLLASADRPVVMLHRKVPGVTGRVVVSDDRAGGRLATQHLLDHGHTRIMCLTGPERRAPVAHREAGWASALRTAGVAAAPADLVRCAYTREAAAAAGRDLLSGPHPPSAIFVTTDEQAVGVLAAAAELGIGVPDRLAVVSMDGIPETAFTYPPLSTVELDVAGLAAEAVRAAFDPSEVSRSAVVLPVELRPRRSCGCHQRLPR